MLHCRAFLGLQVLACMPMLACPSSSSQATPHMITDRMTHHDLPHSASQRKVKPLLKVVESGQARSMTGSAGSTAPATPVFFLPYAEGFGLLAGQL